MLKKLLKPLIAVSVSAVFFVYGCATGTKYKNKPVDIEIPAKWEALDTQKEINDNEYFNNFLDDFNDVKLKYIVNKSLEHNLDLLISAERINYAKSVLKITGADLFPVVSGGLNFSRSGIVSEVNNKPYRETENNTSLNLDISWEMDLWGRIKALKKSELVEFLAVNSDYESAKLSYGAMTAKAWFSAIESKLQTRLSRETLESFEKSDEIITKRFRSGLSGAMDVRLVRSEKLAAKDEYIGQEKNFSESVRALRVLMGDYPFDTINLPDNLPVIGKPVPTGIPSDLLKRRPDISAAKNRIISADFKTTASEKALFPSITLTSGAGTSSSELKNLLNVNYLSWNAGSGILMPIFQGGKLREDIKRNSSFAKEAWLNYQKTVLNAFHEAETAIDAQSILEKRESVLKDLVKEAKASLDKAWDSYLAGESEIITVLDSRRSLIQAQKSLISVSAQRLVNRVDLYLALGGGLKHNKSNGNRIEK
ncbi:MAG: efflux transporter outer membrane subunit [Desulforegulaceae bacterium]|nr:efflux transporter outer membrane subunit [Desulforegulaceae bacterium]